MMTPEEREARRERLLGILRVMRFPERKRRVRAFVRPQDPIHDPGLSETALPTMRDVERWRDGYEAHATETALDWSLPP